MNTTKSDRYYYTIYKILEESMYSQSVKSCDNCDRSWVDDYDSDSDCSCNEFIFIVIQFEDARDADQLLDKSELLSGLQEERAKILFNPNRIAKLINEFGFDILDTLE